MNGANLEFGVADSENVTFMPNTTGKLKLDHSLTAPFTGTIAGLTQKTGVDLADLSWVQGQMHATFVGNRITYRIFRTFGSDGFFIQ
jgi:hypothetical protein